MKIHIKSEGKKLSLWLPTNLIFSRGVAWLGQHYGMKYAGSAMKNIPPEAIDVLFAEFRRIKRIHGSWELVNLESSSGERVIVIL